MTTTDTQTDPKADPEVSSSVPNFLLDEEDDSITQIMPGAVQQPENSAEPESKIAESATVGADRRAEAATISADSQPEAVEFNPIIAGDQNEFDDEDGAESTAAPTGKEWKERVAAGEVKGYEHPNKGKNPDSPTKKKRSEGSTYRRRRLGEKDFRVLSVLLFHEFLTTRMVGIIRDISAPSARRLMLGLQELGVVGQEKYDYGPQLWYLTGKGKTALEEVMAIPDTARTLHRKGHFDQTKIRPNLLAAHVTALLVAGRDTIRQFIDLPLSTGIDLVPFIIPESFTRSEFTKALPQEGKKGGFSDKEARRIAIRDHWKDLRNKPSKSIESLLLEHPELWMVTGESTTALAGTVKQFHPADLILNLLPVGHAPVYIEIETSMKEEKELRKTIRTYFDANAPRADGPVVYLTNQETIAKRVRKIAQEIYEEKTGMRSKPKEEWKKQLRIRVAMLKDADGNPFSGNVWDL
ncbi:hypothetical protein AB0P00_13595 [Microbacterium sp. NPDC077057]|uniref:hypothetical protein n=1 Tax=Microbacterium sp. NPDC077057 TaxID=3154763 RepID=UPI00343C7CCB